MNTMLFVKYAPVTPRPLGMVEVDIDIAAERIMIINRTTGALVHHGFTPNTGILKRLVPLEYTLVHEIMVGILDDGGVYSCTFVDGVKAEIVDANTIVLT
jgi:hypothetical protein